MRKRTRTIDKSFNIKIKTKKSRKIKIFSGVESSDNELIRKRRQTLLLFFISGLSHMAELISIHFLPLLGSSSFDSESLSSDGKQR